MNSSKDLLDSLTRGETNIKHYTLNNKHQTLIANMVSSSPLDRGVELTTEVNLCEGPFGPEGKPSQDHSVSKDKVIGIGSDLKPLATSDISYAALTLHRPNPKKLKDNRQKVNLDFVVKESTVFNKLMFALTQKDSEFYLNLPDNWDSSPAYADSFNYYRKLKDLKIPVWIGKGCIRQSYRKGRRIKSKMRLNTAMVLYKNNGEMSGRCWLEAAVFDFEFDQVINSDLYLAKSEPFQASVVWDESPWL